MKQGEKSIIAFHNDIKSACDQLAMIGDTVSPRDKVMYFIDGLREEFQGLVESISVQVPTRLFCPYFFNMNSGFYSVEASHPRPSRLQKVFDSPTSIGEVVEEAVSPTSKGEILPTNRTVSTNKDVGLVEVVAAVIEVPGRGRSGDRGRRESQAGVDLWSYES